MNERVFENLPKSSVNDIEGNEFRKYIEEQGIIISDSPTVAAYQGVNTEDLSYVSANDLNHILTLLEYGEESAYAKQSILGSSLDDYNYEKSLTELDQLFNTRSYSFSSDSLVFKGVRVSICYYKILNLENRKVGEKILFPGFLSTTVSLKKANDFISSGGFLLIISGLDDADCVVPNNAKVINSPTSNESEQEIILNRGTVLEIISYDVNARSIRCKVCK